jgi:dUTP pyrophosphatase
LIKVKIKKIKDNAIIPKYAHQGDAGVDLYSTEDYLLKPGERVLVSTGISMAIPEGHVGLIWDRSGLAVKHSLHVLAGVVDSGYRGEVCVVLKNLGHEDLKVTKAMRIAQMLIQPVISAEIEESDSLDETSRNKGGFGSTGTH